MEHCKWQMAKLIEEEEEEDEEKDLAACAGEKTRDQAGSGEEGNG
jgi:hypothetical protein